MSAMDSSPAGSRGMKRRDAGTDELTALYADDRLRPVQIASMLFFLALRDNDGPGLASAPSEPGTSTASGMPPSPSPSPSPV